MGSTESPTELKCALQTDTNLAANDRRTYGAESTDGPLDRQSSQVPGDGSMTTKVGKIKQKQ